MKKSDNMPVKLVVFFLGLAAFITIAVIFAPLFAFRIFTYIFSCISIVSVYVAGFLPVLIGGFSGRFASVVSGMSVYYKGMSVYAAATVINVLLLVFMFLPLAISIAIQCVAGFVFLIWAILTHMSKEHIDTVQQDEDKNKFLVVELRRTADRLAGMSSEVENAGIRTAMNDIAENLRYLSPSNSEEAHGLERRMLTILNTICMDSCLSGDTESYDELENKMKNFNALYQERKKIY